MQPDLATTKVYSNTYVYKRVEKWQYFRQYSAVCSTQVQYMHAHGRTLG
jgi:hypothetical protein